MALGSSGPASALIVFSPHFLGVVGAGQDLEIRVDGDRVLLLEATAGTPNLVAGHPDNAVANGRVGATIGGGGGPGSEAQKIWGDYGTIGGGRRNDAGGFGPADDFPDNTVRGGDQNTARAASATIGGGWVNVASGNFSTVSGGSSNHASGFAATIGGGWANLASGTFATIPGGQWGLADRYGQLAFSAGYFTPGRGQAQTSLFVLRGVTSSASPTELFLDGGSARLTIAPDRALAFRITAVGRASGGGSAGYTATGVVANRGGTTSLVGGLAIVTVLGEDASSWDFAVVADDSLDALLLLVTGSSITSVRWVATVEATEVAQ